MKITLPSLKKPAFWSLAMSCWIATGTAPPAASPRGTGARGQGRTHRGTSGWRRQRGPELGGPGAQAVLLGLTGQDEAADALAGQMARVKVACDFVRLTDYPTITKLRVLSRNQQLLRLDFEEAFHDVDASLLMGKVEQALPEADVMILRLRQGRPERRAWHDPPRPRRRHSRAGGSQGDRLRATAVPPC